MGCEEVEEGEVLQGRSVRELLESDRGARGQNSPGITDRLRQNRRRAMTCKSKLLRDLCLTQLYPAGDAVKRRVGAQSAGPQLPVWEPGFRGWWFESGTELHLWCLAAVCSACAAYGWPCWPVDTTGSGWTRERVPQKPNQNALQYLLSSCLPGRYYLAPPVQLGRPKNSREPLIFYSQFLDALSVPVVLESWRTIARYGTGHTTRPQRKFPPWESICPRSQSRRAKNAPRHQWVSLSSI